MEVFNNPYIDSDFEIARLNTKDRQSYEASLKEYRDLYSVMKTAREEGKEEGKKEGKKERKVETAINLIRMDVLSDQQIADAVGLSVEQVKQLREPEQED
jgi:predicted transposase/invertase (TIGR01784 family)